MRSIAAELAILLYAAPAAGSFSISLPVGSAMVPTAGGTVALSGQWVIVAEVSGAQIQAVVGAIAMAALSGQFGDASKWTPPSVRKAANSDIVHASERAVERGVSPDTKSAADALRELGKKFKTEGLPPGTIPDPKRPDSVLVPFGNGYAVYEITKKGTAILRTVLGGGG